jgi:metal-responsive CopG/Arc/MetJ family transcriptional regulator
MLVLLGARAIVCARRPDSEHRPSASPPLVIGLVHGLAGSGAMARAMSAMTVFAGVAGASPPTFLTAIAGIVTGAREGTRGVLQFGLLVGLALILGTTFKAMQPHRKDRRAGARHHDARRAFLGHRVAAGNGGSVARRRPLSASGGANALLLEDAACHEEVVRWPTMKQELVRFGVAMEPRLIEHLDEVAAVRGSTRSEVLRDLARAEVTRGLVQTRVPAVAAVTLVYNHHVREPTERLTTIQHDFGESDRIELSRSVVTVEEVLDVEGHVPATHAIPRVQVELRESRGDDRPIVRGGPVADPVEAQPCSGRARAELVTGGEATRPRLLWSQREPAAVFVIRRELRVRERHGAVGRQPSCELVASVELDAVAEAVVQASSRRSRSCDTGLRSESDPQGFV